MLPLGTVPLPGAGSLTGLSVADVHTPHERGRVWIGWTDLLTPPQVHRFELATGRTELEEPAPGAVAVPEALTEQRELRSADGTTVRMFVVTPKEGPARPRPTLVTGYGGFGISVEPTLQPLGAGLGGGRRRLRARVAARRRRGGRAVAPGGNRGLKQNVFDDLHAAAGASSPPGTPRRSSSRSWAAPTGGCSSAPP